MSFGTLLFDIYYRLNQPALDGMLNKTWSNKLRNVVVCVCVCLCVSVCVFVCTIGIYVVCKSSPSIRALKNIGLHFIRLYLHIR